EAQHGVLRDLLNGRGQVDLASGDAGLGLARATAKQRGKALVGEAVADDEVEAVEVEAKRAVVLEPQQVLADGVGKARRAIRCQAHQLVFARVDTKPTKMRERAVEQAQRVREANRRERPNLGAATVGDRGGLPFT